MKTAIFSSHTFEKPYLKEAALRHSVELTHFEAHLGPTTAKLAEGFAAIAAFVSDKMDRETLRTLAAGGTKFIALRSAGFNNVDLKSAQEFGIRVCRVPAYSPNSVAEHTVALILGLNRKLYKSYNRVREGNFNLDGLLGFDLNEKTVGVVGTGKIGIIVARILKAFGCRVLAFDVAPKPEATALGVEYVSMEQLCRQSDILTLHCPLSPATKHLIDQARLDLMKRGVMIVNTSRGALVDTQALIRGLKSGHIGHLGLDVYEEEEALFFEDHSDRAIPDDVFARLLTFPNVLITGHQGFFTSNALRNIAETTLLNLEEFRSQKPLTNEVRAV